MLLKPACALAWNLDIPGKVLHADERHLEFTGDPPA